MRRMQGLIFLYLFVYAYIAYAYACVASEEQTLEAYVSMDLSRGANGNWGLCQ